MSNRITILFPSSYFSKNRVDEDLKTEYDAVLATGLFDVLLFGYDEWFNNGKLVLNEIPKGPIVAIYRGWMMKPEVYDEFYDALLQEGIRLVTTLEEYETMHVFPIAYHFLKNDTPKMKVFPLHEQISIDALNVFGRFMVKDFVKSVKGTEFPMYFESNNLTQETFDRWMEIFYQYRGTLLTGGICIKEYVDLKKYDGHTNEYRVFYFNKNIISCCRNSGQNNFTPEPPKELIEKYNFRNSIFYTIDYAELEDGSWKILEAGDGQVSGLSDNQNYEAFFRAIYAAMEGRKCPACDSYDVARIIFGFPLWAGGIEYYFTRDEIQKRYSKRRQRNESVLGGCMVGPNMPDFSCRHCGKRF